ncbi:MAG TPA: hypothetical protein DCE44_00610 [Verrucomicrobiales bacterium]|nr:hypothetical protein [Verrucomicrobiales bacterium]
MPPAPPARGLNWIRRLIRWGLKALKYFVQFLVIAWASLVIYYSNLPWPAARLILALAFGGFAICALWVVRRPKWRWTLAGAFVGVVIWYASIPPSNDRPWRAEVARPPRAVIEGDRVRFLNYRNFTYRSRDDFDIHYEEREVDLSRLVSVDLLVSYWKVGPVAHTFLSFNFDDGSPPVCISIETRPEVGEGFDPLASLFKQFELVYVVGDERDLVRLRTDYRGEEVFLYRLRMPRESARALFLIYLGRINSLAERPEWYHLLKSSCTINVIRYSRAVGGPHRRFEINHFLNGLIDAYLYRLGILDTRLSFSELRRRSHINDTARAAGDVPDFSARIRRGLPGTLEQESPAPGTP